MLLRLPRVPRSTAALAVLLLGMLPSSAGGEGMHANRDRQLAPARWWCRKAENTPSTFCKTAGLGRGDGWRDSDGFVNVM